MQSCKAPDLPLDREVLLIASHESGGFHTHGVLSCGTLDEHVQAPRGSLYHLWDLRLGELAQLCWTPSPHLLWGVVCDLGSLCLLHFMEIKPVNPKGNQPYIFIGRTDVEAETPIVWPPDAKSWLIGKDPDAGKDWGQEEKGTTEDEMVGWHHQLNRHGLGWTPGVGDGQGGLVYCSSWSRRVGCDWVTELTDWPSIPLNESRTPCGIAGPEAGMAATLFYCKRLQGPCPSLILPTPTPMLH